MKTVEEIYAEDLPLIRAADEFSASQRVLFAAVSEPSARGCVEVEALVRSLRLFGGRQAGADFRVFFVGEVPGVAARRLEGLGVDVRVCGRFHEGCPHANKLAMFREADGYDYLLGLDTDIVVAGDLTQQVFGQSVAARPSAIDHVGDDGWADALSAFGLAGPDDRYVSTGTRTEMIVPYFNSGVVLVPEALVGVLHGAWAEWAVRVLEARGRVGVLAEQSFFTDQIALALAVVAGRLPRRALPLSMNMQVQTAHPVFDPGAVEPLLVHHHHRFARDGLLTSMHARLAESITRFNEAVDFAGMVDAYGLAAVDERSVEGVSR